MSISPDELEIFRTPPEVKVISERAVIILAEELGDDDVSVEVFADRMYDVHAEFYGINLEGILEANYGGMNVLASKFDENIVLIDFVIDTTHCVYILCYDEYEEFMITLKSGGTQLNIENLGYSDGVLH